MLKIKEQSLRTHLAGNLLMADFVVVSKCTTVDATIKSLQNHTWTCLDGGLVILASRDSAGHLSIHLSHNEVVWRRYALDQAPCNLQAHVCSHNKKSC